MDHQTQQHHDRMVLVGVGEAWLAMLCWSGLLGAALMALGRILHRQRQTEGRRKKEEGRRKPRARSAWETKFSRRSFLFRLQKYLSFASLR